MLQKKGKEDEGEKEKSQEKNGITVVLKTEMHCEGCATKIRKCVKTIEGIRLLSFPFALISPNFLQFSFDKLLRYYDCRCFRYISRFR